MVVPVSSTAKTILMGAAAAFLGALLYDQYRRWKVSNGKA
jgi:hypothetical protein